MPLLRKAGVLAGYYSYGPVKEGEDYEGQPLAEAQSLDQEAVPLTSQRTPYYFLQTLPWIVSTIVFACLALFLYLTRGSHSSPLGTYEEGFTTDFAAAKSALKLKQVQFYGGISVTSGGSFEMSFNPDEPRYVGRPTPEVDKAWEDLIDPKEPVRYVGLSDKEAFAMADSTFWGRKYNGTYWAAPDVLHTLHCVDYLRKSVDLDYYPQILIDVPHLPTHRMHLDHCIELLRQTVSCFSDITPVPRPYANDRVGWLSLTDGTHTCRDLDGIHEWVAERAREDVARQSGKTGGV